MSRLARVDLNQVPLDHNSFIGQVVAAGLEYEQLPPRFMDSLQAYLRIRGLGFAQRNRTGIALGRDQLRQGMERGLACMDLALEEESGGDLNAAVAKLVSDPFDALYKQGWERAFQRLKEMRQQARALVGYSELGFWPDRQSKVEALAKLVPETWTGPSAIDLHADGQMLQELTGKVAFVRSLPQPSVAALLDQVDVDFAGVLHRVILALALGRVELVAKKEHVSRFHAECFDAGGLRPHVRRQVLDQFVGHLEDTVADADVRVRIADELSAEIEVLEQAAARGDLAAFFLSPFSALEI
ncbi:MAG: hypothetical protein OXH81_17625 [Gemmatimonadetes bacterium]|nr:hypothetical protein [Gemmatimonadota bacterium]MDE2732830.1 hypothetical protein [Gemmatimonadota bacterium]